MNISVTIPPRWIKLAIVLFICGGWLWLWIGLPGWSWPWTGATDQDWESLVLFLGGTLLLFFYILCFGIHYRITEKYLWVCFACLPIRRIKWNRISGAQYVHAWRDPKMRYQRFSNPGPVTGSIIYVTIDRCTPWIIQYTPRWRHNVAHPFRAFTIWLPYDRKEYFIEAFKKHYPDLEMQPLDDWKKF